MDSEATTGHPVDPATGAQRSLWRETKLDHPEPVVRVDECPELQQEYFDGFAWAVPKAFIQALDICRFEQGDVLYDTRRAYMGKWSDALPHISYSIQVKYPLRGSQEITATASELFKLNWGRTVSMMLTDHKTDDSRLVFSTQGRLYMALWLGDLSILDTSTDTPARPLSEHDLLGVLRRKAATLAAEKYFRHTSRRDAAAPAIFMVPIDEAGTVSRSKILHLSHALSQRYPVTISSSVPEECGVSADRRFAPTTRIVCFYIGHHSESEIHDLLKVVLYRPSADKQTDVDMFRLNRHGILRVNVP